LAFFTKMFCEKPSRVTAFAGRPFCGAAAARLAQPRERGAQIVDDEMSMVRPVATEVACCISRNVSRLI
jgi:hypothetical protein